MALFRSPLRLLLLSGCLFATSLEAETFLVDKLDDDGSSGTLRRAVEQAEANPGPDLIVFDPALAEAFAKRYDNTEDPYSIELDGEIAIASPEGLVIAGEGLATAPILSGRSENRIFKLDSGAALELVGLVLTEGQAPHGAAGVDGDSAGAGGDGGDGGDGGAILNDNGTLTLRNCIVEFSFAGNGGRGGQKQGTSGGTSGNGGNGGKGGAIYSGGGDALVRIERSTLEINDAGDGGEAGDLEDSDTVGTFGAAGRGGSGGAVHCDGGRLEIVASSIRFNNAGRGGEGGAALVGGIGGRGGRGGDGGGIAIDGAAISIVDSTIQDNSAGHGGFGGVAPTIDDDEPAPISTPGPGGDGGDGGGLHARHFVSSATAQVAGSLFHQNRAGIGRSGGSVPVSESGDGQDGGAGGSGGGLFVVGSADTVWTMRNSTIHKNFVGAGGYRGGGAGGGSDGAGGDAGNGGGIAFARAGDDYAASLVHLTVVENEASSPGWGEPPGAASSGGGIWEAPGGIAGSGSGVTLANSVVALNWANADADLGSHLPEGRNLVGGDPRLGPLSDNGGPTLTLPPLAGSPTINGGLALAAPLGTDQRGSLRPLAGAPDLGAFEARYQVDARIGTTANPAAHRIDNIYTPTGAGQTQAVRLKNMRQSRFFLSAQNDGEFADHLRLSGPRANKTLRLKVLRLTGGTVNVTGQVVAGHVTPGVAPDGVVLYRVDAKARTKKRRARQTLVYRLSGSVQGPVDVVRAKVTQKMTRKKQAKRR